MISFNDLMIFSGAALVMVLTPGPNMIYLISRSISQGRRAGVISLFGVVAGFIVHMLAAAIGLTALFMAVPLGYELLKWLGVQRYFMGFVLAGLAVKLMLEKRNV
jgi:threonine/homoserine/homoserine lactone efflux protein